MGAADRGETEANEGLLEEHERLSREARVQVAKLEFMHIVDWEQAQEADVALAGCHKWLSQEGHAATQARYPPQGVPWSRSRDGTGQDVLPYLQQSHPE